MRKMEQATNERIQTREELMRSLMERMKAYQQALMEVVRSLFVTNTPFKSEVHVLHLLLLH